MPSQADGKAVLREPRADHGLVALTNGLIEVSVATRRGGELRRVAAPGGANALATQEDWSTPASAERSGTYGSSEQDWLSGYRGGWQVLLPNAGPAGDVAGAVVAFHGELSVAAWSTTSVSSTHVTVEGQARLPISSRRTYRLADGLPVLYIEETVTNESDMDIPFLWGHHPAFPATRGTEIDLPGGKPHGNLPTRLDELLDDGMPDEGIAYLADVDAGWAAVRQPHEGQGLALSWDHSTFPHLWMWTMLGAQRFPWFGRAHMVTVEPMTQWPVEGLETAAAHRTAHLLGPAASKTSWVTAVLIDSHAGPVRHVDRSGTVTRSQSSSLDAGGPL